MHLAIDHRDGRAPITLAADQPIAIAIVDRTFANAFFSQSISPRRGNSSSADVPVSGPELTIIPEAGTEAGMVAPSN